MRDLFSLFLLQFFHKKVYCVLVTDWVPKTRYSGTRIQSKNGFKQVEHGFSSFVLTNFLAYLRIFQSYANMQRFRHSSGSTLKNHQICTNICQNKWRKALLNCCLKTHCWAALPNPVTRVLGTRSITNVDLKE